MRQSKHHSRSVSQLLIVGLLSCWVALTIGLLSYWLVMLRLIKSILKRKGKNEIIERVKPSLATDTGNSPGLSPEIEPELLPAATQPEPETLPVATQPEPETLPAATQPEPETLPVATQPEPEGSISASDAVEAYCVKCRQRRMIQGAKKVTTQKGRHAMEGICPVCSTKLFRFIAREKETLP
jgi:hypothetical protein